MNAVEFLQSTGNPDDFTEAEWASVMALAKAHDAVEAANEAADKARRHRAQLTEDLKISQYKASRLIGQATDVVSRWKKQGSDA